MEHWDRELEQRVWRRVRGETGEPGDLAELIRLSRQQVRDLKQLDRILYDMERQTLALLTGLHMLQGGKDLPETGASSLRAGQRLLRCRERCSRMLEILVALENDGRYGPVFTDLTRLQRAKCARLEQLARIRPGRRYPD